MELFSQPRSQPGGYWLERRPLAWIYETSGVITACWMKTGRLRKRAASERPKAAWRSALKIWIGFELPWEAGVHSIWISEQLKEYGPPTSPSCCKTPASTLNLPTNHSKRGGDEWKCHCIENIHRRW